MVNENNTQKQIEYDIDGIKVKVTRESNNSSKSIMDCLLDLFLRQQHKQYETSILDEMEDTT